MNLQTTNYQLSSLPYQLSSLEPFISEKLLTLHYQKHHQSYVDNANKLLEQLAAARQAGEAVNYRDTYQALTFNVGGVVLHDLFWNSMSPAEEDHALDVSFKEALEQEFGSIDRFKDEFTQTALAVQGSAWVVLALCKQTKRLMLMQVKDHSLYVYPGCELLMALDMWEHAFYLDYQTDKKGYVERFWSYVNWNGIGERFEKVSAKEAQG